MTEFDENFNITHTKSDTLEETQKVWTTVNDVRVPFSWSDNGFVSGKCEVKVRQKDIEPVSEIEIDISVDGEIGLFASSEAMSLPARNYFFDIQFTKTDGRVVTWFPNSTLRIEQDTTT